MQQDFYKILEITRDNVQRNPSITEAETKEVALRYLQGIIDETDEVRPEIKEDNQVYLTDELGDIAWDYLTILSVLEQRGLIESAEAVFAQAYEKYSERAPAFVEVDNDHWDQIKQAQKTRLKERHQELYGK
ncbi:nucleotide pyrophosphohydrolase [Candidatus Kaiserbacteria bacterium]|nr:nucleotide pyrophosphohydrolase [Candidatus Kaiserbacteria bacterium]MCB9812516.1 nucleotide pyrophosphohydrolase [Candidatus Nomurabacteria bacterium]